MADVLVTLITSAAVASVVSALGVLVNGQLQRHHELILKRAEEARQLSDLKRERLWSGLTAVAAAAMGVQEANIDLMRFPVNSQTTRARGEELYAMVEGKRADIALSSREGRELLLEVVGAIRRYQALGQSWESHLAMATAQGADDPEVQEHSRFIDAEHDLVQRGATVVLDRALQLVEQLEQPTYPPARTKRLRAWGLRRLEAARRRPRRHPAAELVVEGTPEGSGPD